jgi:hypothetical protein
MINKSLAEKEATALAKVLGQGWKPKVWQNSGWHCCVVKGPVAVYPNPEGQFICRITDKPEGPHKLASSGRLFDTPIEAVQATIGGAKIVVRKLSTLVKVAEGILDESLQTNITFDFEYQPTFNSHKHESAT